VARMGWRSVEQPGVRQAVRWSSVASAATCTRYLPTITRVAKVCAATNVLDRRRPGFAPTVHVQGAERQFCRGASLPRHFPEACLRAFLGVH
jgi:hypothetical protein